MRLLKESGSLKKQEGVKTGLTLLSSVVQIPIFLGLYRTLASMPGLVGCQFLWIASLGSADALYLLPALVALMTYLQHRTRDQGAIPENQQLVMKLMPAVSFVFMMAMPAGLVLYYATSGALQWIGELALKRYAA